MADDQKSDDIVLDGTLYFAILILFVFHVVVLRQINAVMDTSHVSISLFPGVTE